MDEHTQNYLQAHFEAQLAKLPPEAQAIIRAAPPPTEAQRAALAGLLASDTPTPAPARRPR